MQNISDVKSTTTFNREIDGVGTVSSYVVDNRSFDLIVQTIFAEHKKRALPMPIGKQVPINTPEANKGIALDSNITGSKKKSNIQNQTWSEEELSPMISDQISELHREASGKESELNRRMNEPAQDKAYNNAASDMHYTQKKRTCSMQILFF